jgi:hypothetical protein
MEAVLRIVELLTVFDKHIIKEASEASFAALELECCIFVLPRQ